MKTPTVVQNVKYFSTNIHYWIQERCICNDNIISRVTIKTNEYGTILPGTVRAWEGVGG